MVSLKEDLIEENQKLLNIVTNFKKVVMELESKNKKISDKKVELYNLDNKFKEKALEYKRSNKELKITLKDMEILIEKEKHESIIYRSKRDKMIELELDKRSLEKKYEMLRHIKAIRIARSENLRCLVELG